MDYRKIIGESSLTEQQRLAGLPITEAARTFTTRAAFHIGGKWKWIKWTHKHANKHAAIINKAKELGADRWDFGNADHYPSRDYPISR